MRLLSLFSGIGLHDLGLERAGWEVAGQVECDPWCLAVLAKHWPSVPRWEDVRDVTAESIRERAGIVDLITGGFPCTDISLAGKGAGLSGEQSGLWREMLRIVRGVSPAWCFVENVPALRLRGAQQVVSDLEASGYTVVPPVVVGAWAAGAPHRRDRVWIVARRMANSDSGRRGPSEQSLRGRQLHTPRGGGRIWAGVGNPPGERGGEQDDARYALADDGGPPHQAGRVSGGPGGRVADADRNGVRVLEQREPKGREAGSVRDRGQAEPGGLHSGSCRWPAGRGEPQFPWEPPRLTQPRMGGVLDGSTVGLDGSAGGDREKAARIAAKREARFRAWCRRQRLRALGNANPPDIPELIGRWILSQA